MKHAGSTALDALEPLLRQLRGISQIREKTRGVFYKKSRAFLHFHEDPTGLYADIRPPEADDFVRLKVDSDEDRDELLARTQEALR